MIQTFIAPWATVLATDTTVVFYPASGWRQCGRVEDIRATLELAGEIGTDIEVSAAVQVCNTPDVPGGVTLIGAWLSAVDVQYPTTWTSVTSAFVQNQEFRFGYAARRVNGAGLVVGRVQATFEFTGC